MNRERYPDIDTVEQRFTDRPVLTPPPGHRDRVLAAVRDALAADRTTQTAAAAFPGLDAGSKAALGAMAMSALVVVVGPWVAIVGAMTHGAGRNAEPASVAQARAAGIEMPRPADLFAPLAATARGVNHTPLSDAGELQTAGPREILRLKTLLKELL